MDKRQNNAAAVKLEPHNLGKTLQIDRCIKMKTHLNKLVFICQQKMI